MASSTVWWLIAGAAIVLELLSGTVYLLLLSAGFAAAAVAAHAGAAMSTQLVVAAIVGVGATRRLSAVKWGVAGRIVWAWILTIPAAAFVAAVSYWVVSSLHKLLS